MFIQETIIAYSLFSVVSGTTYDVSLLFLHLENNLVLKIIIEVHILCVTHFDSHRSKGP